MIPTLEKKKVSHEIETLFPELVPREKSAKSYRLKVGPLELIDAVLSKFLLLIPRIH